MDHQAPPRTSTGRPTLETAYIAPRSAIEARLVRIWEDVLATMPIGMNDDFFDLDGESLHAFAVMARVLREFEVALTPQDLFDCATVGAMAAVIAQRQQRRQPAAIAHPLRARKPPDGAAPADRAPDSGEIVASGRGDAGKPR